MLIGIMADTHDNLPMTRKAVERLNREEVGLVLHAGDVIAPFMIAILRDLSAPVIGVFGNNDGDRDLLRDRCGMYPDISFKGSFAKLDTGGISIGLIHGADRDLLDTLITGQTFDLVVSGHTHRPEIRKEGRTMTINPGEVCGYLTGNGTVAIVDSSSMAAEILVVS